MLQLIHCTVERDSDVKTQRDYVRRTGYLASVSAATGDLVKMETDPLCTSL